MVPNLSARRTTRMVVRSGGSLEVAVSHDDDLSQGKISSHVRAKVKIVLMMIFLNGKDHHPKILFLLASHLLICLLIGQKLIIVLIPSYWIMCPLIGQWLNLVL